MKYVITESQLQRLSEITVLGGSMGEGSSYEHLIFDIFPKVYGILYILL